jgi:hypothetical protein
MPPRKKVPVFLSFDYDHDSDLRTLLIGQSRHTDSPFSIADWSIKYASRGWKAEARQRIRRAGLVIVICGNHTDQAVGVAAELAIAKEEKKNYFLLAGRKHGPNRRPQGTWFWETIHAWTWDNLRSMTSGKPRSG